MTIFSDLTPSLIALHRRAETLLTEMARIDCMIVQGYTGGAIATRNAAQAECLALASQLQEANAQVARLRRGWLTTIQIENSCDGSGAPCGAKRCGCVEEMEMLLREDDERAALVLEAPRHD
jgi:hypothetical protein